MASYDNFYRVWNIIGYTGELSRKPTVYFMTDTHFGYITQQHKTASNIGRMCPIERYDEDGTLLHRFGNEWVPQPDGTIEWRHVEHYGELTPHTSRNYMVRVDGGDIDSRTLAILARAIVDFPALKQRERPGFRG